MRASASQAENGYGVDMREAKSFLQTPMGRILLLWNALALVAFGGVWFYATWVAPINAPLRVTELDRAGILDEGKLQDAYPGLAENTRRNVGRWIAEEDRRTAIFAACIGTVIAAVNIVWLLAAHYVGRSRPVEGTSST